MSSFPRRFGALLITAAAVTACHPSDPARLVLALPDSTAIRRDISYLASPALEGRATGTAGNDSAAAYLARRYQLLGLRPIVTPERQECLPPAPACPPEFLQHFVAHPPPQSRNAPPPGPLLTENVVALLAGTDRKLRSEYLVIGAHFDHLGRSSVNALDPEAENAIRPGADDNASGTAAVLALAHRFVLHPTRRSLIFVNFTGEELGLLGSAWFAAHPPVPLDRVRAMFNFDMVGRLRNDRLIVYGVATATELRPLLDSANAGLGLKLNAVGDGFGPSDQSSFYAKDVPVLHFFTDLHDDYHRATDVASKIDAGGEVRVIDLAERVARSIADRPSPLTFKRSPSAATAQTSSRDGTGVYLGTIPDMGAGDMPGMKLTGVRAGSPADAAGIKAGDVIVEFGGREVKNIYSYTDAMNAFKPGDVVKVVVLRGGERVTLSVTLGKRGG